MKDNEMDLLLRSFDDELDAADRGQLESFLESSEELRAERDRVRRLRRKIEGAASLTFAPNFADRVMAALPEDHSPMARGRRRDRSAMDRQALPGRGRSSSRVWRITASLAAAAFIAMAIGLAVWLQPTTVTVPHGTSSTVELADGSVVELSSGTSLTYRRFWARDERRVTLDGEAFFDVVEEGRPFVVETFNASISVLGTRFNVRAWANDPLPETSVALETGRVAVSPLTPGPRQVDEAETGVRQATGPVVLEPGQATSIVRDSLAVRPPKFISMDHVTAWRSGGLAFANQPVGSVLRTVERRYDVDIRIADIEIQSLFLTYLNPQPRSAEDVISDICHTLDLRYRQTANGFEILPSEAP